MSRFHTYLCDLCGDEHPAKTKCPKAQILEDSLSDQDYPDSDSPFLSAPRNKREKDEDEDFQFDYYKDRVIPDYYPEDEELEVEVEDEDEVPDEDREKKDDSKSDDGNEGDVDEQVLPTPKRKRNVQPMKARKRAAKVAKRAKHEEANEPSTSLKDAMIEELTEQLEASCSCSESESDSEMPQK